MRRGFGFGRTGGDYRASEKRNQVREWGCGFPGRSVVAGFGERRSAVTNRPEREENGAGGIQLGACHPIDGGRLCPVARGKYSSTTAGGTAGYFRQRKNVDRGAGRSFSCGLTENTG